MKIIQNVSCKKLLVFFILIAFYNCSYSQTIIGDSAVYGECVFSKVKSPYLLTGTINIKPRSVLTIEPGVKILISDKAKKIFVEGKLNVIGKTSDSVFLTPETVFSKSDFTIEKSSLSPNSSIKIYYMVVENFNNLYKYWGWNTDTISSSRIHNCDIGIGGSINVIKSYIHNCRIGMQNNRMIMNSIIANCSETAFEAYYDYDIQYSIFHGNKIALKDLYKISSNSMFRKFKNNLVYNNQTGVEFYSTDGSIYSDFSKNYIHSNDSGLICYVNSGSIGQSLLADNKICNNKFYNLVYTNRFYDFDVLNVCWCTNDANEIRRKIYDGKYNQDLGFVSFSSIITDCDSVKVQVYADTFSIAGLVHQGTGLLSDGVVIAVEKATGRARYQKVNNGVFKIDSLRKSEYILYVVPNPVTVTGYLPTYYVNKVKLSEAISLNLLGKIKDVDIYLVAKPSLASGNSTIQGRFSYADNNTDDTTVFGKNWFGNSNAPASPIVITENPCKNLPVLLYNGNNELVQSTVTDIDGYFGFQNISSGTYKALGQRINYSTENAGEVVVDQNSVATASLRLERIVDGIEDESALSGSDNAFAYPNPFKDELQLKGYNGKVLIYDLAGNLYFETTLQSNETINSSIWSSGFYLLKTGNKVQKLIKQD
jgi:hypothetical protein